MHKQAYRFFISRLFVSIYLFTLSPFVQAQIQVSDDSGQSVILAQPARKIISLSPGLTELIYAAGGSDYIKGVVTYSDFPAKARKLPRVGSYNALDIEKILMLQPDLIIAWKSGNPKHQIEQLKKLGLTVYISEPHEFMDIPRTINIIGKLMATEAVARKKSDEFNYNFIKLKDTFKTGINKKRKRVFIQIWDNPVMTVSQNHLISKVISFCGGDNIFAQTQGMTISPSIESILALDPEIIIATGMAEVSQSWLKQWQQWPFLSAVKNQQLYSAHPDHLVRHTPRILQGIKEICQLINSQ